MHIYKTLLAFLAFLSLVLSAPSIDENTQDNPLATCYTNPCVDVSGVGKIMGSTKDSEITGRNIYSYYSIPYGKPTSGDLRFAPPERADQLNDGAYRFDGSYTTYLFSWLNNICPQAGISLKETADMVMNSQESTEQEKKIMKMHSEDLNTRAMAGSEDCLNLAVFTPRSPSEIEEKKPLLPVMFFIHGGAFYMGTYIGMGPKALLEHDVVLVEIQYRVGPLGYMCLDHPEIAGNMGMMDQALALDWVRDHIRDFGGNPDEITVFGESAGAASASYHMLSPMSRDKFKRTIAQSGSALAGWAFDHEPEKHAKDIASKTGCPTGTLDEMVQCLKYEKSAQDIVDTHTQYIKDERFNGRMGFGGTSPCAQTKGDRVFIDKHPEDMLKDGDFAPKDIVFGANKHEGSFVLGVMYNNYIEPRGLIHDADFLTHSFMPTMLDALGLQDTSGVIFEVVEHDYFNITDLGNWDQMMPGMINLVGTFFIKAATYEFMRYNSMHGGKSHFYSLEYEGENSIFNLLFTGGSAPPVPHGCTHADDLIYLFTTGLFDRKGDDLQISQDMTHLWANFAISGEFITRSNTEVPIWSETDPHYLKIDVHEEIMYDYIYTWNNPDRQSNCPGKR